MISKYSFGIGDRFAKEGVAQLKAFVKAKELGVNITAVWNKSFREHKTVNSDPASVRMEADEAVNKLNWEGHYLVDADHINKDNVDSFTSSSDFFTIDVAQFIGQSAGESEVKGFLSFVSGYTSKLDIPGIEKEMFITQAITEKIIHTFLIAAKEAAAIYNYIASKKQGAFITEVSMDEVEKSQNPLDLFFILAALAYYKVPVNTIAPKFTGRFNKGVDYEGKLEQFEKEFEEDILVIKYCIQEFDLPKDLKLSVHTGSDKFSLYPIIGNLIKKHDCGLHLKTAGTTWLEELIGMAEAGGEPLNLAKSIYTQALDRYDELTTPYSTVLSIDKTKLPIASQVADWSGEQFARALIHNKKDESYNPHFRQLLHTAYKIAAEEGDSFFKALKEGRADIERNVTYNIFDRHIKPLFLT